MDSSHFGVSAMSRLVCVLLLICSGGGMTHTSTLDRIEMCRLLESMMKRLFESLCPHILLSQKVGQGDKKSHGCYACIVHGNT